MASSTPAVAPFISSVRGFLAQQLRSTVVGPNAEQRQRELFASAEPGWFADDAPIRIVHADAAMFVGGLRALLLQSLHPLAMAGVAQHSDYRNDPWGRLQRTADFVAATTFGPAQEAERAVAVVRRVHERVRGVADDGRPYSANDPHLLGWVHIAEVDSFAAAHRRHGAQRLGEADYDRYVADMATVAAALGVTDPPSSQAELRSQLRSYRRELHSTPAARDAARYLLLRPPLPAPLRPVYGMLAASAVSLLPVWSRMPLRVPWLPITERVAARPSGELVTRTLRWVMAGTDA